MCMNNKLDELIEAVKAGEFGRKKEIIVEWSLIVGRGAGRVPVDDL